MALCTNQRQPRSMAVPLSMASARSTLVYAQMRKLSQEQSIARVSYVFARVLAFQALQGYSRCTI